MNFLDFIEPSLTGRTVRAVRKIHQSPLSSDPDVPPGREGEIVDEIEIDGLLAVDFGGRCGVVLCEPDEVRIVP